MRYFLIFFLSWVILLPGQAQSPSLLLQNSEYNGLINPANSLNLKNINPHLTAGLGYRQLQGSGGGQGGKTENRLGFFENQIGKDPTSGRSGMVIGGYLFEERSRSLNLSAAYLHMDHKFYLNRVPGNRVLVAAGLNFGFVQYRFSNSYLADSSMVAIPGENFFKVLPDWNAGAYFSFDTGIGTFWGEFAVPPSFGSEIVNNEKDTRFFSSLGLPTIYFRGGLLDIYNKFLLRNGKISDHIIGLSYSPTSNYFAGVSYNTRQEKIYFDIGLSIRFKGAKSGNYFYRMPGLSFKYTYESKGKSFQAHSIGIIFFQRWG